MKKAIFTFIVVMAAMAARAQFPIVPVDSLQFINQTKLDSVKFNTPNKDATLSDYVNPNFKNSRYGDTVVVEGIALFEPISYGLSASRQAMIINRTGGGPWSGIEIMSDSGVIPVNQSVTLYKQNMKKGRKVRITGRLLDFQGESQVTLLNVQTEVLDPGPFTITPTVVKVEDLNKNIAGTITPQFSTAEQWEGVYVELRNVTVYLDPNQPSAPNRYFWSVRDSAGNEVPVRDFSGYFRNDNLDGAADPNTPRNPPFTPPATGTKLDYIRGVIMEAGTFASKRYYIGPLYPGDVGIPANQPPYIRNVTKFPGAPKSTDSVKITAKITDNVSVSKAEVYYTLGYASTTFNKVTMLKLSDSIYVGTIPPQPDGSIVKYFVRAEDDLFAPAAFPDSLGTNSAYKVVNNINSILIIQETPFTNGASLYTNDTLRNIHVPGVVTSTNDINDLGLFHLQSGNAPWAGIFVLPVAGDGVTSWKRGDSIIITEAIVTERTNQSSATFGARVQFGTTFLENVKFTVAGHCSKIPDGVTNISIDNILTGAVNRESYEAVILKYNNVYVVNKNPDAPSDFGEFSVHPDSTKADGLRADDISNDIPSNYNKDSLSIGKKELLSVFKGPLVFTFGNWNVIPRNRTDLGRRGDMIPPSIFLKGTDTVYQTKGVAYTDPGADACDDVDGDVTSGLHIDASAVDVNVNGTYQVNFDVKDAAGNQGIANRIVVVSSGTSIDEFHSTSFSVYPVPAGNELTIKVNSNYSDVAHVNIIDINGRTLKAETITLHDGTSAIIINTADLSAGVYFCQLSGKYYSSTLKFTVMK